MDWLRRSMRRRFQPSTRTLASLATFAHFTISDCTSEAKCSGDGAPGFHVRRRRRHGRMIIDAVAKKDRAKAEKLMLDHLDHIEGSLQLENSNGEVDLEAIFKS